MRLLLVSNPVTWMFSRDFCSDVFCPLQWRCCLISLVWLFRSTIGSAINRLFRTNIFKSSGMFSSIASMIRNLGHWSSFWLPTSLRGRVLQSLHWAQQGVSQMCAHTEGSFFWSGMTPATTELRACCSACNRIASSQLDAPWHPPHNLHILSNALHILSNASSGSRPRLALTPPNGTKQASLLRFVNLTSIWCEWMALDVLHWATLSSSENTSLWYPRPQLQCCLATPHPKKQLLPHPVVASPLQVQARHPVDPAASAAGSSIGRACLPQPPHTPWTNNPHCHSCPYNQSITHEEFPCWGTQNFLSASQEH